MKLSARLFSYLIAFGGGFFSLYMTVIFFLSGTINVENIAKFIFLTIALLTFRSLPLYIDSDRKIDLSFIGILTAMLVNGTIPTIAIIVITTPLIFDLEYKKKKKNLFTIINTSPIKTLFNLGNYVISVYIGGIVFEKLGGVAGIIKLPYILFPMFLFIIVVNVINCNILFLLLSLDKKLKFWQAFGRDFLSMIPTWIAVAPLGYFFAYLVLLPSGEFLALLLILPLWLARYSFKLYIDSRKKNLNLIHTLSAAIEARDEYTNGHSQRVHDYAEMLAKAMHLPPNYIEHLKNAALLHDIGKIGISDGILHKPAKLDTEEWQIIKQHPQIAVDILKNSDLSPAVIEIILHHHGHFDGSGYPVSSGDGKYMICAHILEVADTFDAITSDRPYRKGRTADEAINIIIEQSGHQFAPEVVTSLVKIRRELNDMFVSLTAL